MISSALAAQVWVNCDDPPCAITGTCDGSAVKPYPSIKAGLNALGAAGGKIIVNGECTGTANNNIQIKNKNIEIAAETSRSASISCELSGRRAFIVANAGFTLEGMDIFDCGSFSANGGALHITQSNAALTDVLIFLNYANRGAGIFATDSSITIDLSQIALNFVDTTNGGGGIFQRATNINYKNSFVRDNTKISDSTPTDIHCIQGSASNVNSILEKVTCNSCWIPNATGQQVCNV